MAPRAIISYDDTPDDHDALMLGRMLADAGAEADAGVRAPLHARRLLAGGARGAGGRDAARAGRRLVLGPDAWMPASSSARRPPEGLRRLAEQEEADIVVFGSDYRTAAGHIAPQRSTQALLEGGTTAVAIAPAGYHGEWAPRIRPDRRARDPRRRRHDRDRARARRQLRRDAHARRAPGRPADRRLPPRGHARPRADERSRPERDRERDLPGAGHAAAGSRSTSPPCSPTPPERSRQDQVAVAELVPQVAARRARPRRSAPAARGRRSPRASAGARPRARASR